MQANVKPGTTGNSPTPADATGPTLLFVDDEPQMRRAMRRAIDEEPYRLLEAASAEEALEILKRETVHVIVSDHNMPGMCGLDLLRMVKLRYPAIGRIMVTANLDFDVPVRAINLGEVSRFLCKPWEDDELRCSLRQAFEHVALEREVRLLRKEARRHLTALRELEAQFPGIANVKRDKDGTVLIDLEGDDPLRNEALWRAS